MQAQISFDYYKPHFVIDKPIRLIELFAGIGAQSKALENLGVKFEHYQICEFDKYAVKSYNAIYGTEFVQSDITRLKASDLGIVDTNQYCYILTYSFPCQDLSIAGKQAGMKKGSKTRSGLLWEVERLLNECTELPQVLLMENVTQVHNKKNSPDFNKWIESLKDLGYSNYYADLNAKNYGVPQNRNRTFMISILGNYFYEFPEPFKLEKRLKDILEKDVDEKYYLLPKISQFVTNPFRIKKKYTTVNADIASSLKARDYASWNGNYVTDGLCCSIDMAHGGNRMPKIIEIGDSIDINYPNSTTRRGRHIKAMAHTITSENNSQVVVVDNTYKNYPERQYDDCCPACRIRRLTPKECFRLMTFDDTDFEKCKAAGISDSQLYKQAGNSIVVDVLVKIFAQLFEKK